MLGGTHGGLGAARVQDENLRAICVSQNALPHDRMGDTGIGPNKDQYVSQFEIRIRKRRGVESEALFVGHVSGSHALSGVGVAVDGAYSELPERAQQGHFFGANLPGAEEGDAFWSMFLDNPFEIQNE
jgi:hypothetical protein